MSVIDSRVVNIDDLKLEHFARGDRYECNAVRIGPLLGSRQALLDPEPHAHEGMLQQG